MKKIFFIATALIAFSCSNGPEKDIIETATEVENLPDSTTEIASTTPASSQEGIETSYVGDFEAVNAKPERNYYYKNKINISIDSIRDTKVFGHSVVAGNQRPFAGTSELKNGIYTVTAKEPGDDKYDGTFSFKLNSIAMEIEGTWKAFNPKLEVAERKYKLTRKWFSYDSSIALPENLSGAIISQWNEISKLEESAGEGEMITADAMKINASTEKLKKENVENMYKGDLELMRNSIYARHGYSFKNRKMRYIFDNLIDWYIPYTTDVRNDLTALEKENIALIKRYEEHASRYYDSYGR